MFYEGSKKLSLCFLTKICILFNVYHFQNRESVIYSTKLIILVTLLHFWKNTHTKNFEMEGMKYSRCLVWYLELLRRSTLPASKNEKAELKVSHLSAHSQRHYDFFQVKKFIVLLK